MTMATQGTQLFSQMTGAAVEMFTLCADANQKLLRELVDLSATAAKEGVRLYAELQSSAVEAVKDGQAYAFRRQTDLQDAPMDPLAACQRGLLESAEGAQQAFKLFEGNAQAVTRSAERLQVSAEHAGKEIQTTFAQLSDRVKSLYAPLA
jgi:hypothetical protein